LIDVNESFVKIARQPRDFPNSTTDEAFNVLHRLSRARLFGLVEEGGAGDGGGPLELIQVLLEGDVAG